jgi:hypothetical protein
MEIRKVPSSGACHSPSPNSYLTSIGIGLEVIYPVYRDNLVKSILLGILL